MRDVRLHIVNDTVTIHSVPGRLFRIRPISRDQDGVDRLQRELDTISRCELHLSSFDRLNDPFEFTVSFRFDSPPEVIARYLAGVAARSGQRMDVGRVIRDASSIAGRLTLEKGALYSVRQWGVCCFTEDVADEAMWAYYGEGHQGIAVVYDSTPEVMTHIVDPTPPLFPLKVEYAPSPVELSYFECSPDGLAQASAGRKSLNWSHEKEWRLIGATPGLRTVPKRFIVGLVIGLRTPRDVRGQVADFAESHGLETFTVRQVPKSYNLEIVQ